VDWHTTPQDARRQTDPFGVALQGNLDPCTLYAPVEEIRRRTHAMIEAFGPVGHVANLGHGILPDMKPDHARAFIDAVQEWQWTDERRAAALANAAPADPQLAGVS
jgi:uroporphyrinogen decarboxylase